MKLKLLDPDKGYRNEFLWLPKARAKSLSALKNSLTFVQLDKPPIVAWYETETHLVCPREFIPFERWGDMQFEIEDRTFDDFPEVEGIEMVSPLRDDVQRESLLKMLERGSGILSLGCGKGKTVVALAAWVETRMPGLVVVNEGTLMNQWIERIVEHTNLDEDDIGVYQGDNDDWEHPITLATVQTLVARVKEDELPIEFQDHFGVSIYDEVHMLGAPEFNKTASLGRGIRWGLSATPGRADGMELLYQYHIGPILYQNLEQDEIPQTWFIRTGIGLDEKTARGLQDGTGDLNLAYLYTWLSEHPERNKKILEWIDTGVRDGRTNLVLTPRVEHVKWLHEQYKDQEVKTGAIYGEVKVKDRTTALNESDLIFAITKLGRQGLDRQELDTLTLLIPVADEGMMQQIYGRIQRSHPDKNPPAVLVFEDEKIAPMNKICQKMRHMLTNLKYPFELTR